MTAGTKSVFLSHASQDAEVARRICEALRAAGVAVWFDKSELRDGGMVTLKVSPFLDSVRDEPRFKEIERLMNFPS